jgi:FdhE protein
VAAAAEQLARLAETHEDLRDAAALQAALIRAVYAEPAETQPVALDAEAAHRKLAAETPLLRGTLLPLKADDLRLTFLRLVATYRQHYAKRDKEAANTAAQLEKLVQRGDLDVWALANALVDGRAQAIPADLEAAGVPVELTLTLLRLSLLPFLEQAAAQLAPLRRDIAWKQGYCPTCGAFPVLAEQRGLEQFRYARCGLCADTWQLARGSCAFCGNRDHKQLGYLHVEGEQQQQRVATCDACGTYLKLRSTLTPFTTPQLLAMELALVHLDLIAMDKGYLPPA